jgi:hypothetical protein
LIVLMELPSFTFCVESRVVEIEQMLASGGFLSFPLQSERLMI